MTLEQKIEAVLFYKATPVTKKALIKLFDCTAEELTKSLSALQAHLNTGAIRLFVSDTEVELGTAPELDALIESIRKDEMKRDIGKAGAETLAIILYKGPIARADIDRIRGVNSAFILRNLLVRGLIEKDAASKTTLYRITTVLMAHLGITEKTDLPEFVEIMNTLEKFEAHQEPAIS